MEGVGLAYLRQLLMENLPSAMLNFVAELRRRG